MSCNELQITLDIVEQKKHHLVFKTKDLLHIKTSMNNGYYRIGILYKGNQISYRFYNENDASEFQGHLQASWMDGDNTMVCLDCKGKELTMTLLDLDEEDD